MELDRWAGRAMATLHEELRDDAEWTAMLEPRAMRSHAVHLAIFIEPFLTYVLEGKKSVESRFSARQCPPFRKVAAGDIILLKAASGPVLGVCQVAKAWFFDLHTVPLETIRSRFAKSICATDDAFWRSREKAEYATLLQLRLVRGVSPMPCPKRDRRGWVILNRLDRGQLALPGTV